MIGPANTAAMGDTGPMTHLPGREPLTATDRCDRCGARAGVRATLPSGSALLFCGHHAREHGEKVRAQAAVWYDELEPSIPAQRG